MNKNSDHIINEELARRYQSGDKEALKELIRRFNSSLVTKIYSQTRNRESVEDIVQECWYAIINNLDEIKFQIGFEAWAMNIARNKAIDWIREQQKVRKRRQLLTDYKDVSAKDENGELRLTQLQEIRARMVLLPQAQRIIVELFYKDNLSLIEISEILNISKGTVKSRLFAARERLKRLIN